MAFNIIPQLKAPGVQIGEAGNDYAKALLAGAQAMNYQGENQRANKMLPSDIALKQAQAANYQSETSMNPLRMDELRQKIAEQGIVNKYKAQTIEAENKAKSAQANYYNMGGGRGGVDQKNELFFQNLVQKDNPQLKPEQIYEASNALRNGQNTLTDGTSLNPLSPASKGIWDHMIKSQNTAQGINQQRYAATAENLINKADENAKAATEYSGLLGKGQGSMQMVAQLFKGTANPKYEKYIKFTRVDVPAIAGEVMRELGANATDMQKQMYIDVVNPTAWDTNPKLALARWEHFKEMSRTVGKSVGSSPSDIRQTLKNAGQPASPGQSVSPQVSAQQPPASGGSFKLPSFKTQKDFQDWYAAQPDVTKAAVALYLKNRKGKK